MKKSKNITTLEALRAQKRQLELEGKVTQREFAHSIGTMNSNLKDFLVNKVAIPVGVVGILAYGIKKTVEYQTRQENSKKNTNATAETKNPVAEMPKQDEHVSASFSSQSSYPTQKEATEYQATQTYTQNNISSNGNLKKQKVTVVKPRHIDLKKWLPVAIQLAKSGWSFYQNNYTNNSK